MLFHSGNSNLPAFKASFSSIYGVQLYVGRVSYLIQYSRPALGHFAKLSVQLPAKLFHVSDEQLFNSTSMILQLVQSTWGFLANPRVLCSIAAIIFLLCIALVIAAQNGNNTTTRRKLKNLQKVGSTTRNMADQYHPKFDHPAGTQVDGLPRIKSIYLHPVKSCGPIEVDRALLTKTGFLFDRCFVLATGPLKEDSSSEKWRFISQRTKPSMSRIETELWLPNKYNYTATQDQSGGYLVMRFDNPETPTWADRIETLLRTWDPSTIPQTSFIVPLSLTATEIEGFQTKPKTFNIHSRDAKGIDMGEIPSVAAALPQLKKFLKIPNGDGLSLFRCTPDTLVRTDKNLAPLKHIGTPAVHGYTDQQPININSLSSVQAVSALLPTENQPMDALRFRANIWIENAPAYDEEEWKRYCILPKSQTSLSRAQVAPTLSVVCRTSRCTMPNVDPAKGTFDTDNPPLDRKKGKPQPSTTLVQYRTVETGNKAALGYLGMHCVPEDWCLKVAEGQGEGLFVEVGDEIEVLERGVHLYGSTGNDY